MAKKRPLKIVITVVLGLPILMLAGWIVLDTLTVPDSAVGIDVVYAVPACPAEAPLRLTITNRLPIRLDRYRITLSAKRSGYSSDVLSSPPGGLNFDAIVDGWTSRSTCVRMPGLSAHSLRYETPPLPDHSYPDLQYEGDLNAGFWATGLWANGH